MENVAADTLGPIIVECAVCFRLSEYASVYTPAVYSMQCKALYIGGVLQGA